MDDRLNKNAEYSRDRGPQTAEMEYECSGCGERFPVSKLIDVYDHEMDQFFIYCQKCWEERK